MKATTRVRLRTGSRPQRRRSTSRYFRAIDKASRLVRFSLKLRSAAQAVHA